MTIPGLKDRKPILVIFIYAVLWLVVYIWGMLVPLFDSDSSHHALIGMHMYLTGNYTDLIDRGKDYLDKPHLLFWLAALGDWLTDLRTVSFKLPSLLVAIPGLYATFRLAKSLYNKQTGFNAVVILLSTQAYILAHNDVRMDALLLSLIITSTWMLYEFTQSNHIKWMIGGSFVLAMAFSTKGMSGAIPPLIAVGSQLIYSRNWSFFRSFRWIWIIPLFFLFASPVLYAYYLQYDLHPEKTIRGMTHISGVAFILFFQNIERLQGDNWGNAGSNDPFLFFHSLLWAMLPWCILGYWAVFRRTFSVWKEKFRYTQGKEILSLTTIIIMFTIMSLSNFKLPHYLNILFPFFAILIAGQINNLSNQASKKWLLNIQKFIAVALVVLSFWLNTYIFPVHNFWVIGAAAIAFLLLVREWYLKDDWQPKLIGISMAAALFTNILLNGNSYMQVQQYQAGPQIAGNVSDLKIPREKIYKYQWECFSFNYYSSFFYKDLYGGENWKDIPYNTFWVVGPLNKIQKKAEQESVHTDIINTYLNYPTTRLSGTFLNPSTRIGTCDTIALIRVKKDEK